MRVLIWNMRGFGRRGRRNQLREYLRKVKVDIIILQETIRQSFSDHELRSLELGGLFTWNWLPASGMSGGMLLGIRDSTLAANSADLGEFFISAQVVHRAKDFPFQFFGVYGPADHSRSAEFLQELESKIAASRYPVVVAGDFNLIRGPNDKNNCNIDWPRVRLFNECIAQIGRAHV